MDSQIEKKIAPAKKHYIAALFNPGVFISGYFEKLPSVYALIVSGMSFFLLFLQTGLDRLRAGNITGGGFAFMLIKGILFGTVGIALLAAVAFVLSKMIGGGWNIARILRAVALGYGGALIYMVLGLLFNIFFKWNTTVAFGITGVLWALGPLYSVFRAITGNRKVPAVIIMSVCGSLTIWGWYLLAAR